jgi:DNA ligase-1
MSASYIKQLNESDSRLHKEEVLRQALMAANLGSEVAIRFLYGLRSCYDPFLTYGIKQIPSTEGIVDAENPYEELNQFFIKLRDRVLTGNAARDALDAISKRFDSEEWNLFLAPILRRDMRAGISEKTINKICKKTVYEIPTFGCQLATNSENRPEMQGIKRLEPKLDGVRVLMFVIPGNTSVGDIGVCATCYSRNGKVFDNFIHIEDQITNTFVSLCNAARKVDQGRFLIEGFVLDGEVIGKTFQELMRQARRKENVQANDSVFNVFDIIPISDFRRGYWNAQLSKRINILESIRPVIENMDNVELLPHLEVNLDTHEGKNQLMRYANDMVLAGFEGIMIKSLDAPYECKRNTFWMKWKPTITVDLQIIEVEQGTGRNSERLGAIVCEGVDDNRNIRVNVGSGFSDADRDEFWNARKDLIGRTVEILCDVITQNQDGTYSLRFPRFVRFRDDKV